MTMQDEANYEALKWAAVLAYRVTVFTMLLVLLQRRSLEQAAPNLTGSVSSAVFTPAQALTTQDIACGR